ncbi:MAG: T9SS type A sorting domain-containing protein [Sphingobacteriaceae bacterium]|nr:T9SS type A sorting domain-containing protein [Sphingobacteriaceae bacterium]
MKQIDTDGKFEYSKEVEVTINNVPAKYELKQNYPNPFNPLTSIQYAVDSKQYIMLKVYDILGSDVATLVNEVKEAGMYEVTLDAANMPSGIYFYKLQAGPSTGSEQVYSQTKKMTLLR